MTKQYRIFVESTPERLEQAGPLVPGWWSPQDDDLGRRMPGQFLLDTGAFGAMIDTEAALALQLSSHGNRAFHGIHGYGSLAQYLARVVLPAKGVDGGDCLFEQVIECFAVPGLTEKSRENGAHVIGILGRMFLRRSRLDIDGVTGRISLIVQP